MKNLFLTSILFLTVVQIGFCQDDGRMHGPPPSIPNAQECATTMIANHISNLPGFQHAGCARHLASQWINIIRSTHSGQPINVEDIISASPQFVVECFDAIMDHSGWAAATQRFREMSAEIQGINNTHMAEDPCINQIFQEMGRNYESSGTAVADPHISTLDGLRYDFQGEGVFTAFNTKDNKVILQVMHNRVPNKHATMNAALAFKYNKSVICVSIKPPFIYINDKPLTDKLPATLDDEIQIISSSNKYQIITPEGDKLLITKYKNHLDYALTPNQKRKNSVLGGLLGNFDGKSDNDLTSKNGVLINPKSKEPKDLYFSFGNSWRIETEESLLTNDIKKTAPKFDPNFPEIHQTIYELDDELRFKLTEKCKAKGVYLEPFLSDCVYDLSVTGDDGLIVSAFENQKTRPAQYGLKVQDTFKEGSYKIVFSVTDSAGKSKDYEVEVAMKAKQIATKFSKNTNNYRIIVDYEKFNILNINVLSNSKPIANQKPITNEFSFLKTVRSSAIPTKDTMMISGQFCRKFLYKSNKGSGEIWVAEKLMTNKIMPFNEINKYNDAVMLLKFPYFAAQSADGFVMAANLSDGRYKYNYQIKQLSTQPPAETLFSTEGINIIYR